MKLRPLQLVCLALLLATLRLADPSCLAPGQYALQAGYLNVLLSSAPAETTAEAAPQPKPEPRPATRIPAPAEPAAKPAGALPPAARATLQTPWTMPPPAFQSAALQSATGFGRRSA